MTKKLFTNGRSLLCSILLLTAFIIPNGLMAEITCSFSGNTLRINGSKTMTSDIIYDNLSSGQIAAMHTVYLSGFSRIEKNAFANFCSVKKIVVDFGNTIATVGNAAFGPYVEELEIYGNFMFDNKVENGYGYNMFSIAHLGDPAIRKVVWSDNEHLPAGAFMGCKHLTSIPVITLNNFPSDYTTFFDCTALKDIYVSVGYSSTLELFNESRSIGQLFRDAERVHIVGKMNGTGYSIVDYAFANMLNLKELYLPDVSYTVATNAFYGCENNVAVKYDKDMSTMRYADWWNMVKSNANTMESVYIPSDDVACNVKIGEQFPKAKKVIISSDVTTIGNEFCRSSKSLAEVVIPQNVTSIGTYAFTGCENAKVIFEGSAVLARTSYTQTSNLMQAFNSVKDITIGANTTVGSNAFYGLTSLTYLTLEEGVTINDCSFYNTNVTDLNLPKNITIFGNPFNSVKHLTFNSDQLLASIASISEMPTKFGDIESVYFAGGVTAIGNNCFARIPSLKTIDMGTSVETIGRGTFAYCANLKEVVLGGGLTSISNDSFKDCQNLTDVTVNSNTLMSWGYFLSANFTNANKLVLGEKVTTIGEHCCDNVLLDEIKLPSGLVNIGAYAFSGQAAISSMTLPATLRSIGEGAFQNCCNLNVAELPSGLITIGNNAFDGCSNITTLTFKNNSFVANSEFTSQDNISTRFPYLENVIFPNVTKIPEFAFCGSQNLKSVTFNGVTVPTVANNSFYDCPNLTEVKYPFAESSISVDSWKAMNSLIPESQFQKLYVPNDKISNSENLTNEKVNLANLYPEIKEITFGAYVTRIGNNLMSRAEKLEVANIGSNVKNIDRQAFAYCPNLTTVNYQGDESKITIDDEAFIGCPLIGQVSYYNWIASFPNLENVKELTIPNNNIADYEWSGLYNIATLFPNVEKVVFGPAVTRIHDNCLKGASNLKEVEFNEGLEYIGLNAIDDCRLLTSITIPSTVEEMDDYAIVLRGQDVDVTLKTISFIRKDAAVDKSFSKIFAGSYLDENGVEIPSHITLNLENVTSVAAYSFQNFNGLTNVTFAPNSSIIALNAFKGCTDLESVEIPAGMKALGKNAFEGMKGRVTLLDTNSAQLNFVDYFGNDVTEVVYGDNITSISFPANYPSLQKLTIGASVQTISGFSQCANLKSVTINSNSFAANANGEGWTQTSNLSAYFPYIKEVSFGDCVQELGANILYGNNTVESVTFSGYNVSVGASAFESCQQLKAVNGNSIGAIGDNAFRGCNKLAKFEGTSYTRSLGVNAFQNCSSLEAYNMHIGCNISTEGGLSNAFDGCVKLKTFIVTGSQKEAEGTPSIEGINFFGGVNLANATLIVDKYFYNAFQNAPVWKDFGNMGTTWYEVFADAIPYNSANPNYSYEITYSRNFKNTEWQALYIPFSLAYEDWKDDFDIAYVNDVHQLDTDDDGEIDMTVLETIKLKSGVTKPSEPYIIRAHSTGKKTIHADAQYILPSEVTTFDVSSRNTIFNFTGTYSGVSGAEMLEKGYYAFGGGSLIQADSADADLLPCRWYMEVVDRNNNPQPSLGKVRVVVRGEDDTTDIKTLVMGNADEASDAAIFDLSGRKVSNAQKGIYIKNGKKIVVR